MPELMEVLEFLDNSGSIMVKRVPDNKPAEIKWGAQLTVRDSQEAIFFKDGQVVDVFKAGRYLLETNNIPLIGKWITSFGYGPTSPFRAEVYFVSKQVFTNLKWGTREPILFSDKDFKMIRIRAFGNFSIQVADSRTFINRIAGTINVYSDDDIEDYLRNIIVSKFTATLAAKAKSVVELPSLYNDINAEMKTALQESFQSIGLQVHDFYVESTSVPEEVKKMIDQRSGMSALGNMDEFMKYKIAMSVEDAANNPGSIPGQAMGTGLGLGMGFMMPQMIQQSMVSATGATATASPVEKLKDLKSLLDLGIISQAEFDAKKSKLLDLI